MARHETSTERRKRRTRHTLRLHSKGKPRLSVFRSNNHISAQLIDDVKGVTLVAASTIEKDLRTKFKSGTTMDAAKEIGMLIAKRAKEKKISKVVFDRGAYLYHGRVKALADAAREGGLEF